AAAAALGRQPADQRRQRGRGAVAVAIAVAGVQAAPTRARLVVLDERLHALDRVERDAAAEAQAADQLAVVDREPAEGRLRHADAPAVAGDLAQQGFVVHDRVPLPVPTQLGTFSLDSKGWPADRQPQISP